jgi:pimeloyl-ACP methyl ester carboxylesterase
LSDDALVLLPGLNCSTALWSSLDVGRAITPILTEPTLDGEVDRLLDELPARFALAGLSLGGIVAMALVRRAPERVSRLCLMSTTSRPPTSSQYAMWARQRAALAAGATARDLQRELKAALLSPYARAASPHLVDVALAMADDIGAETLDAQLALQATRIDERPGLTRIGCPTVIISGRDDALCRPERHAEMHALIAGSHLVELGNCGHLSPLEQPTAVGSLLRRWSEPGLSAPDRERVRAAPSGARPGVP